MSSYNPFAGSSENGPQPLIPGLLGEAYAVISAVYEALPQITPMAADIAAFEERLDSMEGSVDFYNAVGVTNDLDSITVPEPMVEIYVSGFYAAGDAGHGRLRKIAEATATSFQSADGAHWEVVPEGDVVFIEQLGAKADVGNVESGYIFTGDETDNAPIINAAFGLATVVSCRSSRAWKQFGLGSQIVVPATQVLGHRLSPSRFYLVALPSYAAVEREEGVVWVKDTRSAANGFTVNIPTQVYDPANDDEAVAENAELTVAGRLSGLFVGRRAPDTNQFKFRIHNVDVIGGYAGVDANGLETDFKNVRVTKCLIGYINRAHDNEWSATCTATECDVGFRNFAGFEGTMHAVRNRINHDLRSALPQEGFLFDDTPYEIGVRCKGVRGGNFKVYHTKVQPGAVYFELEDSFLNTFDHVGIFRDTGNIDQSNIHFIRFVDTVGITSSNASVRNRFSNIRFQDLKVAATDEDRLFCQFWERCTGDYVARYVSHGAYMCATVRDAGAGATNGNPAYIFLPHKKHATIAGQALRVVGYIHARASGTEDYLGRFIIRVPLGTDSGSKVVIEALDQVAGVVDWTGMSLVDPLFANDQGLLSVKFKAPDNHYAKCRLTVEASSVV